MARQFNHNPEAVKASDRRLQICCGCGGIIVVLYVLGAVIGNISIVAQRNSCFDHSTKNLVLARIVDIVDNEVLVNYGNTNCTIALTEQSTVTIGAQTQIYVSSAGDCSFEKNSPNCEMAIFLFNIFYPITLCACGCRINCCLMDDCDRVVMPRDDGEKQSQASVDPV